MSARVLPARPDLEQYKKQAKELVKERAAAAPAVLQRIRIYHPRLGGLPDPDFQRAPFQLSDAQLVIAREHDFESWPKFAAHIETLQPEPSTGGGVGSGSITERIPIGGIHLEAEIAGVENAKGVVLFTQASGSSRYHPSYRYIAAELNRVSLCTVLTDLLTEDEELADSESEELKFDVRLLGKRVAELTDWIGQHPQLSRLALGYFASGNGAAAAMVGAGDRPGKVHAIVSSAGRPDLAGPWIWRVQAPTLFIVGSKDVALGFTQGILAPLPHQTDRRLAVIEGARQLFEEQDALEKATALARDWFLQYLSRA